MDIITQLVNRFAANYLDNPARAEELLQAAQSKVNTFYEKRDKIKFLSILLEKSNKDYADHKLICNNPEECALNEAYETISFYLSQDLYSLGIQLNSDTFTEGEKERTEDKLNQILTDLSVLRAGQQVIYEELQQEIAELKEHFYLGKKNWSQLLMGKCIDMAAGGVISETLSKQIIQDIKKVIPRFLING